MAHTPGPWIVQGLLVGTSDPTGEKPGVFDSLCLLHEVDYSSDYIHAPEDGFYAGQQTQANGRLMSAAPDLLAACEELEESAEYWSEYDVPLGIVDRLKAAIRKAKGVAEDNQNKECK